MLYDDDAPKREVIVHRSTIRIDVIEIFSDPNISACLLDVIVIDARGQQEEGRGRGVLLDVLTEFWQNVFTSLTVGSGEKVPFIRHDLQRPQWEAIARILVYGYKTVQYFPINLSQLFLASCLFGEESISPDFLLSSFRSILQQKIGKFWMHALVMHLIQMTKKHLNFSLHSSVLGCHAKTISKK